MRIIFALIFMAGIANAQIYIYNEEVVFDGISQDVFECQATNSNHHYGNIYMFQVDTNLLTTNWCQWGNVYYTDVPGNESVPYGSAGYPVVNSEQAFFRFAQVGTNYMFYPGIDTNGCIAMESQASVDAIHSLEASQPAPAEFRRGEFNFRSPRPFTIPDCIYPPGFLH